MTAIAETVRRIERAPGDAKIGYFRKDLLAILAELERITGEAAKEAELGFVTARENHQLRIRAETAEAKATSLERGLLQAQENSGRYTSRTPKGTTYGRH